MDTSIHWYIINTPYWQLCSVLMATGPTCCLLRVWHRRDTFVADSRAFPKPLELRREWILLSKHYLWIRTLLPYASRFWSPFPTPGPLEKSVCLCRKVPEFSFCPSLAREVKLPIMARLTKVYNTDDDDSGYVGRRNLPLVAGDKLMVSIYPHRFPLYVRPSIQRKWLPAENTRTQTHTQQRRPLWVCACTWSKNFHNTADCYV